MNTEDLVAPPECCSARSSCFSVLHSLVNGQPFFSLTILPVLKYHSFFLSQKLPTCDSRSAP